MFKLILFFLVFIPSFVLAAESPLFPVKTDNPRATMKTFYTAMNDYKEGIEQDEPEKVHRIQDAIRCLNAGDGANENNLKQAVIYLKEVIDRVIVLDYTKIPESPDKAFWRLKDTEISLQPIEAGERKGHWLITQDTWQRAEAFYDRVKDLEYLEGSGQGAAFKEPWFERLSPVWARSKTLHLYNWQWIGIFIFILLGYIARFFYHICLPIFRKALHRYTIWSYALLQATEKSLSYVIGAFVFWTGLRVLNLEGWTFWILNFVVQMVMGFGMILVFYKCVEVLGNYFKQKALQTDSEFDDQLIPFLEKSLKVAVVVLGLLVILQNLGVNVFSLLAGLGLGGLAFALAAKDTAANLFGSVMILIDRPFRVGDWINVNGVDGTVEEIGFRSTRIRTFYDSLVSVPNSIVATMKIDNLGLRGKRRIHANLRLTYDTPPEKIEAFLEGLKNIILGHPDTNKENFHVVFEGFTDSSLNIMLYTFVQTATWSEELVARQNIYLQVLQLAKDLGIKFAFPTQTLHLASNPEHPFEEQKTDNKEQLSQVSKDYASKGKRSKPTGLGLFKPPFQKMRRGASESDGGGE